MKERIMRKIQVQNTTKNTITITLETDRLRKNALKIDFIAYTNFT